MERVRLLDELVAEGRATAASLPGPIPPTPLRDSRDPEAPLSELLDEMRDEERYRTLSMSAHRSDYALRRP